MTAPTEDFRCWLKIKTELKAELVAQRLSFLLDLESSFDFLRLELDPIEMVLDSRLGTSGGGGFLLAVDEYVDEYGLTLTFGLM